MNRSATCAPVLVAVVCGLTLPGCGDDDDGGGGGTADRESIAKDDRPLIPTPEGTTTPSATPAATAPPADEAATASLHPCELLTPSDLQPFGVGPGRARQTGSARSCEWTASGRFALTVGIFDQLGARDLVSKTKPRDLRIGSHAARQGTGGLSSCVFVLGVSETSRVDVISAANGDVPKACRVARRAAVLVEPKLP
jgi:Protein of unknown function (DUF3558)